MSTKSKLLILLLFLVILASTVLGMFWHMQNYQMIDFKFYPKDAKVLDLRSEDISISRYNKFTRRMPDCEILWNVPLQNTRYPHDSKSLTLADISEKDLQALRYFPELKTLDVRGCEDYPLLTRIQKTYPELEVVYTVQIGGTDYGLDAQELNIDGVSQEDISRLQFLPQLKKVRLESSRNAAQLISLIDTCKKRNLTVCASIGGTDYELNATKLSVEQITADELELLYFLPQLRELYLTEPQADAEHLLQLTQNLPAADIVWEKSILGVSYTSNLTQLDLSEAISEAGSKALKQASAASVQGEQDEVLYQFAVNATSPLPDMTADTAGLLTRLEQELAYFPNVTEVVMCGVLLDNEAMAAFRETHREDFKVIWNVQCGNKVVLRTDSPYLMPTKYHVYYFLDSDAVNLKYCEDMICIDLGHMAVSKIDFVANMPNLQYLVLAHTQVQRIDALASCKKLKFLELDWSPIKDNSPLKECTALEDLNMGQTFADFTPVGEMTWLKNLWMVGCSRGAAYRMSVALPDTHMVVSGSATVANGWRDLPNYYAMRDIMGMYYMSW